MIDKQKLEKAGGAVYHILCAVDDVLGIVPELPAAVTSSVDPQKLIDVAAQKFVAALESFGGLAGAFQFLMAVGYSQDECIKLIMDRVDELKSRKEKP